MEKNSNTTVYIIADNKNNKAVQTLKLARDFMVTVICYSYFVKSIENIKKNDNIISRLFKKIGNKEK